jgi:hypothetical protein
MAHDTQGAAVAGIAAAIGNHSFRATGLAAVPVHN